VKSPNTRLDWLNRFYGGFQGLTVLDSLDILCVALKSDETAFRQGGDPCPITDLYCDQEVFDLPAKSFVLEWYGGPPGKGRWFQASMLALVVDTCLFAMESGSTEKICNALSMAKNYGESTKAVGA